MGDIIVGLTLENSDLNTLEGHLTNSASVAIFQAAKYNQGSPMFDQLIIGTGKGAYVF